MLNPSVRLPLVAQGKISLWVLLPGSGCGGKRRHPAPGSARSGRERPGVSGCGRRKGSDGRGDFGGGGEWKGFSAQQVHWELRSYDHPPGLVSCHWVPRLVWGLRMLSTSAAIEFQLRLFIGRESHGRRGRLEAASGWSVGWLRR